MFLVVSHWGKLVFNLRCMLCLLAKKLRHEHYQKQRSADRRDLEAFLKVGSPYESPRYDCSRNGGPFASHGSFPV